MAKRVVKVEWKSQPTANGRERLARAVSWMLQHATCQANECAADAAEHELRVQALSEEANR